MAVRWPAGSQRCLSAHEECWGLGRAPGAAATTCAVMPQRSMAARPWLFENELVVCISYWQPNVWEQNSDQSDEEWT